MTRIKIQTKRRGDYVEAEFLVGEQSSGTYTLASAGTLRLRVPEYQLLTAAILAGLRSASSMADHLSINLVEVERGS